MTCILGYTNQIDNATLGGTFTNVTNLQTRYLSQKATAVTSGVIDIDLKSAKTIGVVALVAHLTSAKTVHIQAGTTAGDSSAYDSGVLTAYVGADFAHTFTPVSARYWRITVTGPSISIGRVFIGPSFRPDANFDWGVSLQIESRTNVVESLSGVEYFDKKPNRRVARGHFTWLSHAEAHLWLNIQRTLDVSNEVYWIEEETDTTYRAMRWFLGRLRTLDAVEYPYFQNHGVGFEISELISAGLGSVISVGSGDCECVFIGDLPPPNPEAGKFWYHSTTGVLYIWYVDATSSQWVEVV